MKYSPFTGLDMVFFPKEFARLQALLSGEKRHVCIRGMQGREKGKIP